MLFNTWQYFVFLLILLTLYYSLNRPWQNRLLLAASYFFYSWWDWRFSILLAVSTVVDFFLALAIHQARSPRGRKQFLVASCVFNLGVLGFFKYFNFFVDSTAGVLSWLGLPPHIHVLHIILPAGISFYTFQKMNYIIDIYRREMEPTRDFLTYALFVSYFPHLVAGPIIRAELLLPQLLRNRVVRNEQFSSGCLLIFIGLFKKVAIADALSPVVGQIFASPGSASSLVLLKGVYFFSFQIYCDFSGYTDIARGTSRLLGIELPENFNQPYLSQSVGEFWRRWHISLSSWLRDYLYIPLGGNRHGRLQTYRNLMLTMFLGGLWHGANWTFVAWGCLHGIYLVVHRFFCERRPPPQREVAFPLRLGKIFLTFHLVTLTWVFFRAPDFAAAFAYLKGIVIWHGGLDLSVICELAFYAALILAIDLPQYKTGSHTVMLRWPWLVRGCAYAIMILMLIFSRNDHAIPFVYFQF